MNPLNDDELDQLLRRAKTDAPKASARFEKSVMRGYRAEIGQVSWWQRLWGAMDSDRPLRLPKVLAAAVLILTGVVADRTLLAAHAIVLPPKVEAPVVERVVYKDCPAPSSPGAGLTFNELQPVREMRPRVVRSIEDEQ